MDESNIEIAGTVNIVSVTRPIYLLFNVSLVDISFSNQRHLIA